MLVDLGLLVALDGPAPGRILLVLVVCHVSLTSAPASAAYRRPRIGPPEYLGADHAHQVDHHGVEHHRLGGGCSHPHRTATGGVAVVAADDHDHGRHRHPLD